MSELVRASRCCPWNLAHETSQLCQDKYPVTKLSVHFVLTDIHTLRDEAVAHCTFAARGLRGECAGGGGGGRGAWQGSIGQLEVVGGLPILYGQHRPKAQIVLCAGSPITPTLHFIRRTRTAAWAPRASAVKSESRELHIFFVKLLRFSVTENSR